MLPLLGGLISGGFGLLGNMFSSDTAAKNTEANIGMQRETNMMSAQEAQKNRDFQQQMSSTAYQRASSDMTSAGLNPAMMFGSGSAASTPGGSMASMGTAKSEKTSPFAGLGDAAGKAVSTAISMKQFEKMTDEIANLKVENEKLQAVTKNVEQQTKTEEQTTMLTGSRSSHSQLDQPRARVERDKYEAIERLPQPLRDTVEQALWGVQKGSDVISPFVSGAKAVRSFMPASKGGKLQNAKEERQRLEKIIEDNHYEPKSFDDRFSASRAKGRTGLAWPGQGW